MSAEEKMMLALWAVSAVVAIVVTWRIWPGIKAKMSCSRGGSETLSIHTPHGSLAYLVFTIVWGGTTVLMLGIWAITGSHVPTGWGEVNKEVDKEVVYLEVTKVEESAPEASEESVQESTAEQDSDAATEPSTVPNMDTVGTGRLIVIDAGHQAKGNSDKEPIGPGATEMKAKVASGTKGCVSGLYEYELTLIVSEKLKTELEARGYEVVMVRTTHDVDISNAERAQIANEAGADAFIRIHANGSDNASVSGVETLCQTASNSYNAAYYEESRDLSEQVLDGIIHATGAKKRRVVETDTMSGINWCQVPVTIVEMGFMTNESEDSLMATEDYQLKLAQGMADGIDAYFVKK